VTAESRQDNPSKLIVAKLWTNTLLLIKQENLSATTNARFCILLDADKSVNQFTLDGLNNTNTYCHVQKVIVGPCLEPDESTPQHCHSLNMMNQQMHLYMIKH
jgi:hypothetical protein